MEFNIGLTTLDASTLEYLLGVEDWRPGTCCVCGANLIFGATHEFSAQCSNDQCGYINAAGFEDGRRCPGCGSAGLAVVFGIRGGGVVLQCPQCRHCVESERRT